MNIFCYLFYLHEGVNTSCNEEQAFDNNKLSSLTDESSSDGKLYIDECSKSPQSHLFTEEQDQPIDLSMKKSKADSTIQKCLTDQSDLKKASGNGIVSYSNYSLRSIEKQKDKNKFKPLKNILSYENLALSAPYKKKVSLKRHLCYDFKFSLTKEEFRSLKLIKEPFKIRNDHDKFEFFHKIQLTYFAKRILNFVYDTIENVFIFFNLDTNNISIPPTINTIVDMKSFILKLLEEINSFRFLITFNRENDMFFQGLLTKNKI